MRLLDLFKIPILGVIVPISHAIDPQAQIPFSNSDLFLTSSSLAKGGDKLLANTMLDWKSTDFNFKSGEDVFTPKDLIELPRPGAGVANPAGDLAYVPLSQYSFENKTNNKSIWLVPLSSFVSPVEVPLADGGDPFWLDDRTLGLVVSKSDGKKGSELYTISIKFSTQEESPSVSAEGRALIGTFPDGVTPANFKYVRGSASCLVFSAYVFSDDDLTTVAEKNAEYEGRGNSALVYDSTYERHWDRWIGPKRSKLFTVPLWKEKGKWYLGYDYSSPLKGLGHDVPVEPFGGTDDFDVSETHIIYTAKDPKLPAAWHTKQNIYLIDLLGEGSPRTLTSGHQGATHSPVLSNNGLLAAWTQLDLDGYESDRAQIVVYDLAKDIRYTLTHHWDRSADSIVFSKDDTALYFTAADDAHVKLFKLDLPPTPDQSSTIPRFPSEYDSRPLALTHESAASAPQPLLSGDILFTQSSFTGPNELFVFGRAGGITRVTNFSVKPLTGKDLDKGESVWFEGAEGRKVQSWILKPKGFKEGKKKSVPVVLLIHGGPQGAWEDAWSTRWNPNVFAQQGYFTIAINPTGSTSFGQAFTDGITKDWGGKPFVDLKKGWDHILAKYPEIDPKRAVAAGASWGGYAINWIQGHPELGFGFKALVCHDGVFDSRYNGFTTDELFFFNHDFGGRPFDPEAKPLIEKFSPSNYVSKWSTPQLIIHGSKDYRLPDTEGIGVFHALQQKGIQSRLVIFPDENHWVLNHGNSLKWHYEVFRWFDKFVGKKAN